MRTQEDRNECHEAHHHDGHYLGERTDNGGVDKRRKRGRDSIMSGDISPLALPRTLPTVSTPFLITHCHTYLTCNSLSHRDFKCGSFVACAFDSQREGGSTPNARLTPKRYRVCRNASDPPMKMISTFSLAARRRIAKEAGWAIL
jgi:hypothetical protein